MAGDEGEQELRQKLCEADEAQAQRAVGKVVNLPADRDQKYFLPEREQHFGQPVACKGGIAGRREPHQRRIMMLPP